MIADKEIDIPDTPQWATGRSSGTPSPDAVHLAEKWDLATRRTHRAPHSFTFLGWSITSECGALITFVIFSALWVGLRQFLPAWVMALAFLVLMLLLAVFAVWRAASRRLDRTSAYAALSDPGYRVRVAGTTAALSALHHAEIDLSASFEPAVFRITYAVELPGRARLKTLATTTTGIAIMAVFELIVFQAPMNLGSGSLYMGVIAGRLSRSFLWPTYLRISPGRMDVMLYPFLGQGAPSTRSYDLRTARLELRLGGVFAVYPANSEVGELFPAVSSKWSGNTPLFFERTIIAAALTRAPSPALPNNTLIG